MNVRPKVSFNNLTTDNNGTVTPIKYTKSQVISLGFREMEALEIIRPDLPYSSLKLHRERDKHHPVLKYFTIYNQFNDIVDIWWFQPSSQKFHHINKINTHNRVTIKVLVGHQIQIKTLDGLLIKNLIINNIDSELYLTPLPPLPQVPPLPRSSLLPRSPQLQPLPISSIYQYKSNIQSTKLDNWFPINSDKTGS